MTSPPAWSVCTSCRSVCASEACAAVTVKAADMAQLTARVVSVFVVMESMPSLPVLADADLWCPWTGYTAAGKLDCYDPRGLTLDSRTEIGFVSRWGSNEKRDRRVGASKEHKRQADEIARKINARLALGEFAPPGAPCMTRTCDLQVRKRSKT